MKVLLFSDLHGHAFKPISKTLDNGRNSRLQDAVDVLDEIYDACGLLGVDGVLFAGDLFHARGTLQVATFNAVFEGIAKIKTRVSFFGMLVGNHDQVTKVGDIHACYAFDSILSVLDSPGWTCFWGEDKEPLHVYVVPYTTDKEQVENNLNTFGKSQPKPRDGRSICLAHLGISGAEVGSNFVLVSEHNPTTTPFINAGFDQIFLGHYHKPQILTPNMRYIGATHQHNWGDVGQDRGYLIYDTETNEVDFFEIVNAPKFIKITESTQQCDVDGNFIRITPPSPIPPEIWSEVKNNFLERGARWIEQWIEPTVAKTLSSEEHVFRPGMDLEDMIDSFVEESDTGDLDPATLIDIGKSVLREIQ